jgi:hypothetical protein
METIRSVLEIAYYAATIIGIPVGIVVFLVEKRRERISREVDAYLQTFDRYMTYLQDTLEHADQGCGEFRGDEPDLKNSGFSTRQITLFQILFMSMEQAYTVYTYCHFTRKNHYWNIWMQYFEWWASREDFQRAWSLVDPWLHPELKTLIQAHIDKHKKKANQ